MKLKQIDPALWVREGDAWGLGPTVYVITEAESGFTKIGIASHPLRRLSALQCGNPHEIILTAVFCGPREDCLRVEKRVLRIFGDDRIRGEWLNVAFSRVIAAVSEHADVVLPIEATHRGRTAYLTA